MSDVIEYKCPSCNASMVFDSKSQHMKCPYCDTEMTVEEFQRTQKSEDTQTAGKSISNDNWYSIPHHKTRLHVQFHDSFYAAIRHHYIVKHQCNSAYVSDCTMSEFP